MRSRSMASYLRFTIGAGSGRRARRDSHVASGPHALVEGAGVEIADGDELDALGRRAIASRGDALRRYGVIAIRLAGAHRLVPLPLDLGPPGPLPPGAGRTGHAESQQGQRQSAPHGSIVPWTGPPW